MKQKQKNSLCKCGHEKEIHAEHLYCYDCLKSIEHDFIPDNLKFLEKLYEEKSSKS